ncbi:MULTISPECIES: GNAT family N-acetyltransferase [unclassified Bacillus (in: firmicutes)]|uniref:GNAT family N-acetyltransferase n=1 Tax=unclassified Bacillus (in: firmicutes) TaxID=185979 RepID=UPI000BEF3E83|nr:MULTISPECIES: GNAT family N-acetyltransferase [unclassified Bacillus (in: firmicutes)]PEJ57911.1 N-acetyltransferase [Bacillus sp. AFS002410]PEL12518.1 N-acetyltransferase [Bacillus sp. AFS017336]
MDHPKKYFSKTIQTEHGELIIEGPVESALLETYRFHENLTSFRQPEQQHKAVVEIASLPEARIIIARLNQTIVGYVTYLYPDPLERWSKTTLKNLIELGAIEVIPEFRGFSVAKNMLILSMLDDAMEDYIIITTEYYWHWDLKGTGLNVWEYRKMMEKMMNAGGLIQFATDDPEICSHPANCLMVRIGKRVTTEQIQAFDALRFLQRYMY